MHILFGAARFIVGSVLGFLLLLVPLSLSLRTLVHSPQPIKASIQKSGIYDNAVKLALDQARAEAQKAGGEATGENLLADQGVRDAIVAAVPPSVVQSQAEQAIDAVFGWLAGSSEQLRFTPDFAATKQAIITNLTAYIKTRAAQLPQCTPQQLSAIGPDFNPLTAPCVPAGTSVEEVANRFAVQANESFQLPADQAIEIPTNSTMQQTRNWLRLFDTYIWLLIPLTILTAVGYVMLYRPRREGIRHLGGALLTAGIGLGVTAVILVLALQKSVSLIDQNSQAAALQTNIVQAVRELFSNVMVPLWVGAALYIVLGIAAIILAKRLNTPDQAAPGAFTDQPVAPPPPSKTTPPLGN